MDVVFDNLGDHIASFCKFSTLVCVLPLVNSALRRESYKQVEALDFPRLARELGIQGNEWFHPHFFLHERLGLYTALARAARLGCLEELQMLTISGTALTCEAACFRAWKGAALSRLQVLVLPENCVTGGNVTSFVELLEGGLDSLADLTIQGGALTSLVMAPLLNANALCTLTTLRLRKASFVKLPRFDALVPCLGNTITGLEMTLGHTVVPFEDAQFPELAFVDISCTPCSMVLRTLASPLRSSHCLRQLRMRAAEVEDAGVEDFATTGEFPALEELDLAFNLLTTRGGALIATRLHAPHLTTLVLSQNEMALSEMGSFLNTFAVSLPRFPALTRLECTCDHVDVASSIECCAALGVVLATW
jgi:hypothetical protein